MINALLRLRMLLVLASLVRVRIKKTLVDMSVNDVIWQFVLLYQLLPNVVIQSWISFRKLISSH